MQRTPRLRELREQAALSQENLADISDVARATIADLEAGKRPARPSTLRKLAQALGVEPQELTSPKAEPPPPSEGDERWRAISPGFIALVETLDYDALAKLRNWQRDERVRLGVASHDEPRSQAITAEFARAVERLHFLTLELAERQQESKQTAEASRSEA